MIKKIFQLSLVVLVFFTATNSVRAVETGVDSALRETAKGGDALAQAKLASLYLLGRGGYQQNDKEAASWMLKAARQGFLEAEVVVAAMYDSGLGLPHDVDKATQWYEKAAAQGHGASRAILGKNQAAAGSVMFSYKTMRLKAAKQIPTEYAKRILLKKK